MLKINYPRYFLGSCNYPNIYIGSAILHHRGQQGRRIIGITVPDVQHLQVRLLEDNLDGSIVPLRHFRIRNPAPARPQRYQAGHLHDHRPCPRQAAGQGLRHPWPYPCHAASVQAISLLAALAMILCSDGLHVLIVVRALDVRYLLLNLLLLERLDAYGTRLIMFSKNNRCASSRIQR